MTAKEKAEELINKFQHIEFPDGYRGFTEYEALHCAIITVDEIIKVMDGFNYTPTQEYWQQVKQELTNL